MDIDSIRQKARQNAEDHVGGDFPPWLELDVDEEFLGMISGIRENPWDEGKLLYEVADIETGEVYSLKTHRALISQVEKQKGEVGDYIYVKSLGKAKAKDSSYKYNNYEVGIVKPEEMEE